jgi:two-component system sensor histidine kinase CpxA
VRTVYAKILAWCFATLLLCLTAFVAVSFYIARRDSGHLGPFQWINELRRDDAIAAYQSGGPEALAANLHKMDHYFHAESHLTDSHGKDLATGADRARLIGSGVTHRDGNQMYIVINDPARKYRLLLIPPPLSVDLVSFVPYYLLILLALAGLCWLLAANLASPLRQLALTVDRFGAGELSARSSLARRDEIGDLARAFNQMAVRLQTLLLAERRLLQDISHELRSPLARLSFAAELTKTAPDRELAAARLRKDIDRLTNLVGGLIQVTRAEGEFAERNLDPVALDELVQDIAEGCQIESDARQCRIDVSATPVQLRGDEELLRRAIENVLRNAIRYAPQGTAIEVRLERSGSMAKVAIRDYGPGVPEELLPRVFTPFFRVDDSRDSSTGGVGLGLAIAHRAVSLHHGEIKVRNAAPGLLVEISLPMQGLNN